MPLHLLLLKSLMTTWWPNPVDDLHSFLVLPDMYEFALDHKLHMRKDLFCLTVKFLALRTVSSPSRYSINICWMNKFVNSSHTVVHLLLFQTFFPSSFIETLPSYFLLALPWCLSFLCPFLRCLCSTVFSSWLPLLKASCMTSYTTMFQTPSTHTLVNSTSSFLSKFILISLGNLVNCL